MAINSTVPFLNFGTFEHSRLLALVVSLTGGQIGFTLLHIGLCQPKNTTSILITNILSASLAVISCWSTGFAFAYGKSSNLFLSYENFFLIRTSYDELVTWAVHCSSTVLFITLVNGGFVERMRLPVYVVVALLFSGFVFPIGCHWCLHQNGWLYNGLSNSQNVGRIRFIDKGGVAAIHISAGSIALVAGWFLKPRKARVGDFKLQFIGGQTNVNIFIGGFLAIFSLLGKCSLMNTGGSSFPNGLLTASTSSLVALMFKRSRIAGENWNTRTLIHGALFGLISVSAEGDKFRPYAAFGLGIVSGIAYIGWSVGLKHFGFDDAVETVAIHLGGGICGIFASSLLHKTEGVFYSRSRKSFKILGWSLVALLAYVAWHCILITAVLLVFRHGNRLTYDTETVQKQGTGLSTCKERAIQNIRSQAVLERNQKLRNNNQLKVSRSFKNSKCNAGCVEEDIELPKASWSPTNTL